MLWIILIYPRYRGWTENPSQKWPRMETKNSFFSREPCGPKEASDKKYSWRLEWIKVEIKQDGKHIDAPNYQVREIWWIAFESRRRRRRGVCAIPLIDSKLILRLWFTASTVETGEKSKEGYQTVDGERQPEVAPRLMEAEWKRATCVCVCVTHSQALRLASPSYLSQHTPDYIIASPLSPAGYQQWCLIASKTTSWIMNARSQNK